MRDGAGRTVTLALLTAIYVFNFMDRQILGVLAEPIKHDLRLSDGQLGLLTGFMFALFYTVFGVPVAWLADRTRRIWVIAAACSLWSCFAGASALARSFSALAAARIGVAVGEAGGVPPSFALISDLYPEARRARAIALYSLGVPIGVGAGTAAGGWIAAAFGWRMAFLIVAAPGVLLALALLAFGREPMRQGESNDHAPVSLGRAIALFVTSPTLMLVSFAGGLGAFTCYGLMAWLSAYSIRVLGLSLVQVGSWLSIVLAAGLAAGIWISGALADRFGPRDPRAYVLVPAAGLTLGGVALLAALSTDTLSLALPLLGVTLAGSVSYLAPTVTLVQKIAPAGQRGTAGALLLLCLNLIGLGCGPWSIGLVSDLVTTEYGAQSLRFALYAVVPVFGFAVLANLTAARLLRGSSTAISGS